MGRDIEGPPAEYSALRHNIPAEFHAPDYKKAAQSTGGDIKQFFPDAPWKVKGT